MCRKEKNQKQQQLLYKEIGVLEVKNVVIQLYLDIYTRICICYHPNH